MRKFFVKLVIAICLMNITACENVPMWKYDMFKRPAGNSPYPPMYIKGWQDGCESGAQASANYLYRLKYKFKQDWELLDNREYMTGWDNAYNHCRKYLLQHNLEYNAREEDGGDSQ
jgi:hypothetical protein